MTSWIPCLSIVVTLASHNPEASQDSLRVMTSALLEALPRYEHARPAERSTLRERLARAVTARGEAFERIAREQPETVL